LLQTRFHAHDLQAICKLHASTTTTREQLDKQFGEPPIITTRIVPIQGYHLPGAVRPSHGDVPRPASSRLSRGRPAHSASAS
jgi:hypothetical protein